MNVNLPAFLSKKGPIFKPNLFVKNATKKNLKPLVTIQVKIKANML